MLCKVVKLSHITEGEPQQQVFTGHQITGRMWYFN